MPEAWMADEQLGLSSSAPEAESKRVGQTILDQGLLTLALTRNKLDFIAKQFDAVFLANKSSRNGYVLVYGAVYAIGSRDYVNYGWREHAAQSIRESLDEWRGGAPQLSEAFCKASGSRFPRWNDLPDTEKPYDRMVLFYSYFSAVVHQNSQSILRCQQKLGDQTASPGKDTEEYFIQQCKDFFAFFDGFFTRYP